jgi:hypothetical protein
MCASSCGGVEAFFSASDAAVSQEVAGGKISVQSACTPNTVYENCVERTLINTKSVLQARQHLGPEDITFGFICDYPTEMNCYCM